MKVYIVWGEGTWETESPIAVFSTEDEARKYCNRKDKGWYGYKEFELDKEVLTKKTTPNEIQRMVLLLNRSHP